MHRKKLLVLVLIAVVGGALVVANLWFGRDAGVEVAVEAIGRQRLEALVSASGTIQPQRKVNISASQMGRVTRLAVVEGQAVKAGQFLLEIDPRSLEGQLERGQASVAVAESGLQLALTNVEQARGNLELAQQNLERQERLSADGLVTRESLDRAQNELFVRETELRAREQEVHTREEQVRQERASLATTRYNLSEIIIESPMDGIVTRRNIEEGETAVVGTMNNAGTVLLEISDMSVVEAEIEVDEIDIPLVTLGQSARVTIDAVPNRTFGGRVTEIGNSPIQVAGQGTGQRQATNFRVAITLDEQVTDVRPGFTCTAEITTAVRDDVLAVPIQSLLIRDMLFDGAGALVHTPWDPNRLAADALAQPSDSTSRRETEGVFVVRDGLAVFTPVTIGIAGEQHFEVIAGLDVGDRVITGPYASVRELADGQPVNEDANASPAP